MIQAYIEAKISGRGATPETIEKRRLSCFGDPDRGIAPCEQLRGHDPRRYCGACGCGSPKEAILAVDPETAHSKLEFVKLKCPLGKPGFSNEVRDA